MIGCPHLLHGTVASGARSPGMNTFVSHELHVTIFNALSLMLWNQSSTPPESDNAIFTVRNII